MSIQVRYLQVEMAGGNQKVEIFMHQSDSIQVSLKWPSNPIGRDGISQKQELT